MNPDDLNDEESVGLRDHIESGGKAIIRPFGAKMGRFIKRPWQQDALLNILTGSIRSSKTWAINAKVLSLLASGWWPGGTGLITGNSKASVKTNLLNDIFSIVGPRNYRYNSSSGQLKLMGRPFLVAGAKDESSHRQIKGSTVGLWIGDELTLYPQSFFDMAVSRLSLPNSRMYGSTNPGNPYHYLKADYIDNEELIRCGDVWTETYTLDDNPNVLESKKSRWKRLFTGVFYRRNILGEWAIAKGAIYRDVLRDESLYTDAERPVTLRGRNGHMEHWIAIDDGVFNPFVAIDVYDDGNTVWWDRELYYDGRKEMRQLEDNEKVSLIGKFIQQGNNGQLVDPRDMPGIIIDPSAASLRVALRNAGYIVVEADNDVDLGIRKVSSMLNTGKLRINKQGCPMGVKEMQTYSWNDKKAQAGGKEEPVKQHDHYPDAGRYHVHTRINDWRLAA